MDRCRCLGNRALEASRIQNQYSLSIFLPHLSLQQSAQWGEQQLPITFENRYSSALGGIGSPIYPSYDLMMDW
jgi:hypothetical protein